MCLARKGSLEMRHTIWHLLGCILPVAVIFLLPLLGVSSGAVLFVFIVLMFGCHLLMMRGRRGHDGEAPREEGGHDRGPH